MVRDADNFDNHHIIQLIDNNEPNKGEILNNLLSNNINTNIKDHNNSTILHHLIIQLIFSPTIEEKNEIYELIHLLLQHNKILQKDKDIRGMLPIAMAVELNDTQLTKILLDHGSNPNTLFPKSHHSAENHSLLDEAVFHRNMKIIMMLLEHPDIKTSPSTSHSN
ncbi:Ankyrin repeat protein [Rickettsiales bacterium Ac37b]|nr:Ankyrin repeat protein [Rickettsiales bacterium Ac37b]